MNFYDRYARICAEHGIEPCSQKASDMFKVTRATISTWNKKNTSPKGETVSVIADALNVSTDYLLGRTDDPTDYSKSNSEKTLSYGISDAFNKANIIYELKINEGSDSENNEYSSIIALYSQLDAEDRIKVEGVIQGMLLSDKYRKKQQNLA